MSDLTIKTFESDIAAKAATNPSVIEFISLEIPDTVVTEETHQFSVGLSKVGGGTGNINIGIPQANHFNATDHVSKVQSVLSVVARVPLPPDE